MYVIENAILNIGKNKSRNILLGAIIFTIITATVAALSIYNSTGIIIEDTKSALQCAVRISPKKMVSGSRNEATLSLEQYLSFGDSGYLESSNVKETGGGADGVDAVYYLKQPDMLSAFEAELRSKGLPADYGVRTDESLLEKTAGSVESLQGIALAFLIIVLALGGAIMVLLSIIAIRERKYEIGVLRAMGMKKKKVALGLWTEIIIITCICFMLGMVAGTAISQPVSNALMNGQTPSSDGGSTLADRLGSADETAEQIDSVNVFVNAITALEIFGISVLLASIAGVVSVSRITKYEPINILMERN